LWFDELVTWHIYIGWWFKVLPAEGWRLNPVDVEPGTLVFSVEKAGRSGP
jgi:hypothetical protein